ncbi:MAG: outer membrane beta-barrel protein [Blastocatellia bacterium]|jgi:opacity protein-like surface antigen
MKKFQLFIIAFIAVVIGICAPAARAQSGDYHRIEVFGGYSHARMQSNSSTQNVSEGGDVFSFEPCAPESADILGSHLQKYYCDRRGFNGFDASITFNFTRYLGIKFDMTGHYKSDEFADTFTNDDGSTHTDTSHTKDRAYSFLAGLQFKDNSKQARFKPFAHALVGAVRQTSKDTQTSTGPFNFTLDDKVTSFGMKLGGGIDVRLHQRIDLRLFEIDYTPIFARDRDVAGNADFDLNVAGRTAHNFSISVGLVFH